MLRSELLKELEESIIKIEKEYLEQKEATKKFKTPSNPYQVGLDTRLMIEKDLYNKIKNITSLE